MSAAETATRWFMKGRGYEFCSCLPGCTCNFSGFPSSPDGGCHALVGVFIDEGRCGDVDLSGLKSVSLIDWPRAIHEGGGQAVLVIEPEISDEQLNSLAQIFSGRLGGNPWVILGSTVDGIGVVKTRITLEGSGLDVRLIADEVGRATGESLKNPVTGEPHEAHIVLPDGFIWKKGECGVGSFSAQAQGLDLSFQDSNWIYYEFDWADDK